MECDMFFRQRVCCNDVIYLTFLAQSLRALCEKGGAGGCFVALRRPILTAHGAQQN